ncbi:ion transporter [Chloroflexota bacterium]
MSYKIRRAINSFFEKHEVRWEISMILLAVVYIVIAFLPDWISLPSRTLSALEVGDWVITGFFVLEFAVRFLAIDSRLGYLKGHWLDLLAIIPVLRWLRIARFARVLRIMRVLRAVRILDSLNSLGFNFARFTQLNGVHWMVLVLTGVMFAGSAIIYLSEVGVNPRISDFGEALYLSLLTWLGPGYPTLDPVSIIGQITSIVLVMAGMATWGILISTLAAFFTVRSKSAAVRSVRQRLLRLDDLSEAELLELQRDIADITQKRLKKHRQARAIKTKKS